MTQIEMQAYNAHIRACNAITRENESINWEQRRYEIAKQTMPMALHLINEILNGGGMLTEKSIAEQAAVMSATYADALINVLKERREK